LFFVSLAAMAPKASANTGRKTYSVFSITGEWRRVPQGQRYEDQKDLSWALPIVMEKDDTLESKKGAKGAIVLELDDRSLCALPCERNTRYGNSEYCIFHQEDFKASQKNSLTQVFSQAVTKQPEKYMVAGSRGVEADLADAVVPLRNGRVDLSAVFHDISPGNYHLAFSPIDSDSFQGKPVEVTYTKEKPLLAPADKLLPGLYRVSLVDEKGEPGDSDAWILVSAEDQYARNAAEYERAIKEATKLPPEMDPSSTRALLRAYLEGLNGSDKPPL